MQGVGTSSNLWEKKKKAEQSRAADVCTSEFTGPTVVVKEHWDLVEKRLYIMTW